MERYQEGFVELLAESGAIRFGEFELKSGRTSPYFINAGALHSGDAIARLGHAYADRILDARIGCELVFGPSYKGVPLAVATSIALAERGRNVGFSFDRKERKDHGERGWFVGAQPADGKQVVVVDDVITSGVSVRHSVDLLRSAAGVKITGVVVAVDRQERGRGAKTTLAELAEILGVPILPVVTIRQIVDHLSRKDVGGERLVTDERKAAIDDYLKRYGSSAP